MYNGLLPKLEFLLFRGSKFLGNWQLLFRLVACGPVRQIETRRHYQQPLLPMQTGGGGEAIKTGGGGGGGAIFIPFSVPEATVVTVVVEMDTQEFLDW